MAKYYIKSGTLELIFSTELEPYDACRRVIHECNADDGDVCGKLFVDSKRRKSGALLEEVFLYYHFLIPLFTFTIHVLKF